jgi:hypothetical protein
MLDKLLTEIKSKKYDNDIAELVNIVLVCIKKCQISNEIIEKVDLISSIQFVEKNCGIPRIEARAADLIAILSAQQKQVTENHDNPTNGDPMGPKLDLMSPQIAWYKPKGIICHKSI